MVGLQSGILAPPHLAGEPPGTLAIGPAGWTHITDEVRIAGSSPGMVYDRTGRLVTKLQPGRNNIGGLAGGVYFLRREGETSTQKAVVIRWPSAPRCAGTPTH